jgi:putative transposase
VQSHAYQINRISINYQAQQNQLPEIKLTNPEYKNIHSQVLQNVLKRCEHAFDGFFRRIKAKQTAGFPRFKSASRYESFCYPQSGFSLTSDKLTLSKIGKLKIKLSCPVVGKVKTCTIKKEIDKWFVIFMVETLPEALPKTGESVGIDVGISAFATLSDGTKIDNFKYYESTQKKLRIAQRRVFRRKKGSQRRRKAVILLRKIHQKIKNQRNDFGHKVSTYLVKTYDLICLEKLSVLGLSRGILAKQMNDVAIGNFFLKLKYKAENADKSVVEVNPAYTSQDCSGCGARVKKDLSERVHKCKCGLILDGDENAAINIVAAGLAVLAPTQTKRL